MKTLIRICFAAHFLKFAIRFIWKIWRHPHSLLMADAAMKNAEAFNIIMDGEAQIIDEKIRAGAAALCKEWERKDRLTDPEKYLPGAAR